MKYIIKVLILVITLSSIESVAASSNKSKKSRKPSYVVNNYKKLPKKMPKLKVKQEKISTPKTDVLAVVTLGE